MEYKVEDCINKEQEKVDITNKNRKGTHLLEKKTKNIHPKVERSPIRVVDLQRLAFPAQEPIQHETTIYDQDYKVPKKENFPKPLFAFKQLKFVVDQIQSLHQIQSLQN